MTPNISGDTTLKVVMEPNPKMSWELKEVARGLILRDNKKKPRPNKSL